MPPSGSASAFGVDQLGAHSRAFSYNDPQASLGTVGQPQDRNVELLVDDPRAPTTGLQSGDGPD